MTMDEQLARRRERDREWRIRSLPIGHGRRVDGSYGRREIDLHDAIGTDIPIRTVAFYVVAVLVVWGIASVVPWLGFTVPWWVAYVLLPALASYWLTQRTAPPQPPAGLDYDRIAQLERDLGSPVEVTQDGPIRLTPAQTAIQHAKAAEFLALPRRHCPDEEASP